MVINGIEITQYMDGMDEMDELVVARIKETFGPENATYGVMVWPTEYDREEGLGYYAVKDQTLDEALDNFFDRTAFNSCVEVFINAGSAAEAAICIGGNDEDVEESEWLCLKAIGLADDAKEDD